MAKSANMKRMGVSWSEPVMLITGNENKDEGFGVILGAILQNHNIQDLVKPVVFSVRATRKQKVTDACRRIKGPAIVGDTAVKMPARGGSPATLCGHFLTEDNPCDLHDLLAGYDDKTVKYAGCVEFCHDGFAAEAYRRKVVGHVARYRAMMT
jgi:inosine/xanthosine triphosphate pyrophosphatase family protein